MTTDEFLEYVRTNHQVAVAMAYAANLENKEIDWSAINEAIIERWSMTELKSIKNLAWTIAQIKGREVSHSSRSRWKN